jgi:hypothetical protein
MLPAAHVTLLIVTLPILGITFSRAKSQQQRTCKSTSSSGPLK